ncbi:MAG: VanZ family protein [Planctomycetota bacterium]
MSPAPQSRWDHWYRRMLPAYWIFLAACTHFPNLRLGGGIPESDKLAHTAAFGLLAFLFWRFAETLRRPASHRLVWQAWLCLAAYAAVDEWTQQFIGRNVDLTDWLFNVLGSGAVLAVLEVLRLRRAARLRSPGATGAGDQVPGRPTR